MTRFVALLCLALPLGYAFGEEGQTQLPEARTTSEDPPAASAIIPEHFLENPAILRVKIKAVDSMGMCLGGGIPNKQTPVVQFNRHYLWIESGEVLWPPDGSMTVPECLCENFTVSSIIKEVDGREVQVEERVIFTMTGEGSEAVRTTLPFGNDRVQIREGGEYIVSLSRLPGTSTITNEFTPPPGTPLGGQYILDRTRLQALVAGVDNDAPPIRIEWEIRDVAPPMTATPENIALVKKVLAEMPPTGEAREDVATRRSAQKSFLHRAQSFDPGKWWWERRQ